MSTSRLSFLAIDFETANPDTASICQVGLAKVVDGRIVESTSWLVVPPTGVKLFEPRFIRLHGITPKQVRGTGISWHESLEKIHAMAEGLPFVAHNTSFDKTAYHRASERVGVTVPATEWFDTLTISRRFVTASNHKLPTVAAALNLPDFSHHQAEADAMTCARIALEISREYQLPTVQELWARPVAAQTSYRTFTRVGDLPAPNGDADPNHPLHGHHVVITGELDGIRREDFMVTIAQLGAQPQLNVTKKTTMLVVANYETLPSDYDPSRGGAKEKKALRYSDAGPSIKFVSARQALAFLQTSPDATAELVIAAPAEQQVQPAELDVLPTPAPETPEITKPATVPPVVEAPAANNAQVEDPASPPPSPNITRPELPPPPSPPIRMPTAARSKKKRSLKPPEGLIRGVGWTLIVASALFVLLLFVALIGVAMLPDEDPLPFAAWLIGGLIFILIGASPGLLGVFLLRRLRRSSSSKR